MQKLSLEEQVKTRGRHSVGFSSSRSKKITRSLTEDFEREKEPSTNKNVFINCLSSGRSEGDDSGFTEEQSRRSIRQSTKKLLPKSFSSHYKFSKSVPVPQSQSTSLVQQPEFSLAIAQYQEQEPALGRPSPPCSVDVTERAGSSLQSPLLSADLTTAQTPSEFLALTEDSLSEADAFPKSGSTASHCCDNFGHNDATSQPTPSLTAVTKTKMEFVGTASCMMMSPGRYRLEGRCSTELQSSPETPAANQREALQSTEPSVRNASDPETHLPADHQRVENPLAHAGEPMLRTSSPRTLGSCDQHKTLAEHFKGIHPVSDSRVIPSSGDHHVFNKTSYGYEASAAKVLASSLSPYREGRYIERRLRSSSEGTAGSGRMVLKPKDGHVEASSLRKHRTGSSSSKMNSLDVLNHLGSCELDEDDLMLDLEFLEEQNLQPPVCREDSCHSVMSCAAVLLSPVDPAKEMNMNMLEEPKCPEPSKQSLSLKITKDTDQETRCPHVSRMPNSPSTDWPLQGVEENGGIDSLPFRLMLQECTAVKTLLLKMKRVLQESDVSPSSSTTSLPISPLTEEPLPFKDVMKDECSMLRLQLKDRDELISHLRAELEKVQHLQKAFASRVDKSTQTELLGCDVSSYMKPVIFFIGLQTSTACVLCCDVLHCPN